MINLDHINNTRAVKLLMSAFGHGWPASWTWATRYLKTLGQCFQVLWLQVSCNLLVYPYFANSLLHGVLKHFVRGGT